MATTPENRVKAAIKKWLTKEGFYFFSAAAGPFSVHGVPDIIVCANGTFVGIEVKAPGKEDNLTANQQLHQRRIKDNGGIAIIASSVDTVIQAFESYDLI
jgi:Holliday junction resolvase